MHGGIELRLFDSPDSCALEAVAQDFLCDSYGLDQIPFRQGDVVFDVGAHVGAVSIYLAKRFPGLRIVAFEPARQNFLNLQRNIALNGTESIVARHEGLSGDGRTLELRVDDENTGSCSCFRAGPPPPQVARSTTLPRAFADHAVERCRFLKVDCEGMEYELLQDSFALSRVDYLACEVHTNSRLLALGHDPQRLRGFLEAQLPPAHVRTHICPISE